jgi:hypothetical protein
LKTSPIASDTNHKEESGKMSFQLHLIADPAVHTIEEADRAVFRASRERTTHIDATDRYRKFCRDIVHYYPDLSGSDVDGENPQNIWPEGLAAPSHNPSACSISIKPESVNEDLLATVAFVARNAGLQMLDYQNGHFYRIDARRTDVMRIEIMLPENPPAPRLTNIARHSRRVDAELVFGAMTDQLSALLKPEGFKITKQGYCCFFVRTVSEVQQSCSLSIQPMHNEVMVHFSYAFTAPLLRQHWMKLFKERGVTPEAIKTIEENEPDFYFYPFDKPTPWGVNAFKGSNSIKSEADLNTFAALLIGWVSELNQRILRHVVSVNSLADFALGDWWLQEEKHMTQRYRIITALAQIYLAALVSPNKLDEVIDLAGVRFNAYQWRDYLNDPEGVHLEAIIKHARRLSA